MHSIMVNEKLCYMQIHFFCLNVYMYGYVIRYVDITAGLVLKDQRFYGKLRQDAWPSFKYMYNILWVPTYHLAAGRILYIGVR